MINSFMYIPLYIETLIPCFLQVMAYFYSYSFFLFWEEKRVGGRVGQRNRGS